MVSIIDVTLLQKLGIVFPFLLIFTVVFGLLTLSGLFKDHKLVQALIAVSLAFLGALSPIAVRTVSLMAPWFVIFMVFLTIFLVAIMALGPTRGDILSLIKSGEHDYIIWWVVFIIVLIAGGSLVTALSEIKGFRKLTDPTAEVMGTEELTATYKILIHPKVMGVIFIMGMAIVTLHYLTKK